MASWEGCAVELPIPHVCTEEMGCKCDHVGNGVMKKEVNVCIE